MTKDFKLIELESGTDYDFKWIDDSYGVAEFVVCPVYRYGKLREFHMFSKQQPNDLKHYWTKFEDGTPMDWSISSWTHKDMEAPRVWLNFWCKEHKCNAQEFYVPRHSTKFTANFGINFSINFDKDI